MEEFIRILKLIKGSKNKNSIHNAQKLRDQKIKNGTLKRMGDVGLIKSFGSDYYIEQQGYFLLQQDSLNDLIKKLESNSTKLNKEMLKHTITMKHVTWAISILTLINILLIIYQTFFYIPK